MSPSEGERRLNSAIALRPGFVRTDLNRIREPRQLVEPRGRGAGVDRFAGELEPLPQVFGVAGRGDGARSVQEDRVASATTRAGEHVADRLSVLGRRAAAQLCRIAPLDP